MSLTVALLVAAAAALAALAGHGWWSARRALPRKAEGIGMPAEPAMQRRCRRARSPPPRRRWLAE